MAGITGSNQSPQITQRYLNTPSYAGDPTPGAVVSTSGVSGSIVQPYGGMVGGILTLGEGAADYYSDKTNGQQLYAGDYQYVQFFTSSTATAAQGCLVFWKTVLSGQWIVTPDAAATDAGLLAGIALANTGKGNWWWIQTRGIANVKFRATLTNGSPAIGDVIAQQSATTNVADDPTQSTALTYALATLVIGVAWAAPSGGAISTVMLGGPGPKYYPGA